MLRLLLLSVCTMIVVPDVISDMPDMAGTTMPIQGTGIICFESCNALRHTIHRRLQRADEGDLWAAAELMFIDLPPLPGGRGIVWQAAAAAGPPDDDAAVRIDADQLAAGRGCHTGDGAAVAPQHCARRRAGLLVLLPRNTDADFSSGMPIS